MPEEPTIFVLPDGSLGLTRDTAEMLSEMDQSKPVPVGASPDLIATLRVMDRMQAASSRPRLDAHIREFWRAKNQALELALKTSRWETFCAEEERKLIERKCARLEREIEFLKRSRVLVAEAEALDDNRPRRAVPQPQPLSARTKFGQLGPRLMASLEARADRQLEPGSNG